MVSLAADLRLALDRVSFASSLGLDPDPWQERLLRSTSKRVLLNCARQSGKSTMSGLMALHRALYSPGSLVLCLAPSERQSKELFAKVADSYGRLRGAPPPTSDRKLGMYLPNGSRIEALPGTEKTIRGFSGAALLLVDEAARVSDELYYAVRPMLAVSGGALMMLTTPYGKRGVSSRSGPAGASGTATRSRPAIARASHRGSWKRNAQRSRRGFSGKSTNAASRKRRTRCSRTRW